MSLPENHGRGHTLIEMLAVSAILAVAALLAIPAASPEAPSSVEVVAAEIIQAVRFAQTDAIRTGSYRMVSFDAANNRVRIYALTTGPGTPVEDTSKLVYHPVDKKRYDMKFAELPSTASTRIISATFSYSDGITRPLLGFNGSGKPVVVLGSNAADIKTLAGTGQVRISYGVFESTVRVDAASGRVTLSS